MHKAIKLVLANTKIKTEESAKWALCYRYAEEIYDAYTTKDLAREIQSPGITEAMVLDCFVDEVEDSSEEYDDFWEYFEAFE